MIENEMLFNDPSNINNKKNKSVDNCSYYDSKDDS